MKKFVSFMLVAAMVVATLTGCGSSDNAKSTEAAGESSAAAGTTFKIGGIGPVTGGAALYGLAVQRGAQIAVDEVNAAGGINGTQIEFNFQDDEADAICILLAYLKDKEKLNIQEMKEKLPAIGDSKSAF